MSSYIAQPAGYGYGMRGLAGDPLDFVQKIATSAQQGIDAVQNIDSTWNGDQSIPNVPVQYTAPQVPTDTSGYHVEFETGSDEQKSEGMPKWLLPAGIVAALFFLAR